MTRTRTLLLVTPVVLAVVALLLLTLLLDKEKILELATATIKEQTGATLTVTGPVELALIPRIGISLAEVSLAMPGETQPGLQVRSLELGLKLLPILSGRVEVEALRLDGLNSRIPAAEKSAPVDTHQMSDEQLDAHYAQRREQQAEAGAAAKSSNPLAIPLALNVKVLSLTDSKLELLDADGAPPTIIEIERFEAKDLNLEARPIGLQAKIRLPAEQPITLDLNGSVRIEQQRQVAVLDSIELVVSGITASPARLQIAGEVEISSQVADLQLDLQLGDTRGEGKLRYATFESPLINAKMHFNLLDPALLVLAGPDAATTPETADTGDDDPLPLEALRGIDTRAILTIDKALLGAHSITALQLNLRAVDGVVRINSLTALVHGGELSLKGVLNGKHNTATLNTTGGLAGLDIASALAASEVGAVATGTANLDWKLSSKGRTGNELLAALKGPIKLTTAEVVLQDIGIESMLCKAVALTNQEALTTTFPTSTSFTTLGADIQLANGKAQLRPLRAELAQISLTGNGGYDLLSQDFKATFKARLSPELESLDRACRVSKRLTAIDWPVDCAGNANGEPSGWCKVDTQEILADMTKNEAQRQLKKNAGKLLDKLFN
jgi:AsmA protein